MATTSCDLADFPIYLKDIGSLDQISIQILEKNVNDSVLDEKSSEEDGEEKKTDESVLKDDIDEEEGIDEKEDIGEKEDRDEKEDINEEGDIDEVEDVDEEDMDEGISVEEDTSKEQENEENIIFEPFQRECILCTECYVIEEMFDMINCAHSFCNICAKRFFTTKIKEEQITDITCPICSQPNLREEVDVQQYFAYMDIILKQLIDKDVHILLQTKLRDYALKNLNMIYCSCGNAYCSDSGSSETKCPKCSKQNIPASLSTFEDISIQYSNDIEKYFKTRTIKCPNCKTFYMLDPGGCNHFICINCKHEFCSGCQQTFFHGSQCNRTLRCQAMGLHAHHPRTCHSYLREVELYDLKRLLKMFNICFVETNNQNYSGKCHIKMETDLCNETISTDTAGVCRKHYVEYLCYKIFENKIDPIDIFPIDELEKILHRGDISLPYKDSSYRSRLIEMIKCNLPL